MVRLVDLLLEYYFDVSSKDSYYPYTTSNNKYYKFEAEKTPYIVKFRKYNDDDYYLYGYSKKYERSYKPEKAMAYNILTGEGKAYKINATVMAITLHFMENNKNWEVLVINPVDKKRSGIVGKFLYNNISNSKYNVEEDTDGANIGYIITKK